MGCQLEVTQDNVKHFVEITANKKSNLLEWTIIILIFCELVLGAYDIYDRLQEKKERKAERAAEMMRTKAS